MGAEVIMGSTGDFKSMTAMTRAVEHLLAGGVVGLNFRLEPDWVSKLAPLDPDYIAGRRTLADASESLYQRCYYVGSPQTLYSLCHDYIGYCEGKVAKRRERRIFVCLDEAQLYMNSRKFRENFPWIELFTQHRKYRMEIVLIAHHIDMIDRQLHHLISHVTRSFGFHANIRVPGTAWGWPEPDWKYYRYVPAFMTVTRPRLGGRKHVRFFKFNPLIANLYDSFEVFGFDSLPSVVEYQGVLSLPDSKYNPLGVSASSAAPDPVAVPGGEWPEPVDGYWLDLIAPPCSGLSSAHRQAGTGEGGIHHAC